MSPTRREALEAGWMIGSGLLATAAAWTTYESLAPLADVSGGGRLPLLPPEAYPEGSATFVREGRLYVTRAKGELFAISQKCPHLGCRVPFCEGSARFECPCHGSAYNLAGEHISGPAPRGMDRFALSVEDGRVMVDVTTSIEGAPLGQRKYDTPSSGAGCEAPADIG